MRATQVVIPVADASHVGEVRRRINQLTADAHLPPSECGHAAIVATELATNLSRYATGGEMILACVTAADDAPGWVEMISVDRGPGIPDVARCLEDGHSTGGGRGEGLGAVRRLSTEWDVFSLPSSESEVGGSVIFSRVTDKSKPLPKTAFTWSAVSRPAPHEVRCGDGWRVAERPGEFTLMMVDGLGHGMDAAVVADEAGDVFDADPFAPLPTVLQNAGVRLQKTRGGAMAVVRVDGRNRVARFVGVGNIAAHLRARGDEAGRGLVSHNGIVGGEVRKIQEFTYECPEDALLVVHSDGLQSRWSFRPYAGLITRHPAVIAGILYRDFTRGRDDVTVAVIRLSLAGMSA
jgi:anti-sigma regulatory factor (Ser/Thr protein kinase)